MELENKDIFHAPLGGSTVIVVYLFREVSGRMSVALCRELERVGYNASACRRKKYTAGTS